MFLVTTALEEYWDISREILFLGEWCKLYSRKQLWEKLKYRVMPYHWDDRKKLYEDYLYLDMVYEKYLKILAKILNGIHKVDHSDRYWRIIIGPWLFYFIEILFDRYQSIKNVADSGYVTETWITDCNEDFFTFYDFNDYVRNLIDDSYNHLLYSYLIRKLNSIPYKMIDKKPVQDFLFNGEPYLKGGIKRKIFLNLINVYHRCLPEKFKRFVFTFSRLNLFDLFKLQIKLGQLPSLYNGYLVKFPSVSVDIQTRKNILLQTGANEFECLIDDLIPYHLPVLYIEGYEALSEEVQKHFPKKSDLIFTANGSISIEAFKFWMAEQSEKGAKLVLTQHGGHHGMGLWSAELKHEITISDIYFTWGWEDKESNKVYPMPSGQLFKLKKKKVEPEKEGDVLWVMMGLPRYSYWLYSIPVGPQFLSYLNDQRCFFEHLKDEVKRKLLIRPYMKDFGWNDRLRLKDMMPSIKQYSGKKTMVEQLNESRLFIGTYNSTTYLETFVMDFPTIIFWNPLHWELRKEAEPYFKMLIDVGILHYSAESAAKKVNEIFNDPISWWSSTEVQKAKDTFCNRFAMTNEKWIPIWMDELKKIARRP